MLKNFLFLLIIVIQLPFFQNIIAQKYVKDSVKIRFGYPISQPSSVFVDSVIDNREELKGNEIRISEKTRYLFIPVDRYYITDKSLSNNIFCLFANQKQDTAYKFVIDEFEINHSKGLLAGTKLSAEIRIYEGIHGETKYLKGTLLYQIKGSKPRNKTLTNN